MMVLGSFILSYEKILHAQKVQKKYKKAQKAQKVQEAQKAQKATFFILDVSIRTKNTRRQKSGFFLLDVFMSTTMMPFVFLFAYVRFVLFVPNKRLFSS